MSTSSDPPPEPSRGLSFHPLDVDDEATLFQRISDGRDADRALQRSIGDVERNVRLTAVAQAGRVALRKVIEAHLALVVEEARTIASEAAEPVRLGQLVQDGNLALVRAVERFDASRGARFASYARWMVRCALTTGDDIEDALADDGAALESRALRHALDRLIEASLHRRDPIDVGVSIDFVRARAERARELAHGKMRHPSMRHLLDGARPA